MSTLPIIAIIIGALLVVGLAVAAIAYKKRDEGHTPDYRVFFIMGITWLPLGIALRNPGFWGMGAVFLLVGLANRDKWEEPQKWSELSDRRRYLMIAVIVALALSVVVGATAFFLVRGS